MAKKNRSGKKFRVGGWVFALILGIAAGYFAAAVWPKIVEDNHWFKSRPKHRRSTVAKSKTTPSIPKPAPVRPRKEEPVVIPPPTPPLADDDPGEPGEPGVTMIIEELVPYTPPQPAPVTRRPAYTEPPTPTPVKTNYIFKEPWVAVVLDDWGYNREAVPWLSRLEGPVTLAVLPGLEYSRSIPREARRLGHEVIVHMPMEPKKGEVEDIALKPSMSDVEIRTRLTECIDSIPYAVGVNNHMGSKMTEDARAMRTVLATIEGRGLFFLDSFVTGGTAVRELQKQRGNPVFERDVFLDNVRERGAILRELRRLKLTALKKGYAIGIGHDEPVMLEALAQVMPEWRKEGIRFVKLSELHERLKETQR